MSEQQRPGHRSLAARHAASLRARDRAKDKENIVTTKKLSSSTESTGMNVFANTSTGRRILRSKSANGLKVTSSSSKIFAGKKNELPPPLNPATTASNASANKARKIVRQPFSIFDTNGIEQNTEDTGSYHDSVSLQRSHSNNDKMKTLSRSSSAFGSSFGSSLGSSIGFNGGFNQPRKIKSQLMIGAEKDMADFFKKSKAEDQKQFGISTNNDTGATHADDNNIQEITFFDEANDISSMQRLLTERDSPLYERTHKVSVNAILSSSTDSDDIEETTFDYKDKESKSDDGKPFIDLESLMMTNLSDKTKNEKSDDVEIEIVSRNTNGVYNDEIPDSMEGMYAPMNSDLLSNLWGEPTTVSLAAAEKFESPIELDGAWKKNDDKDCLKLDASEMEKPEELLLEFSEDELNDDDHHDNETDNKKLIEIMEFYQKERPMHH